MKVLMLVTDGYGGHGGIAAYNRSVADGLSQVPGITEVVVLPRVSRFEPSGAPPKVRLVMESMGGKAAYLRAVLKMLRFDFGLIVCGHVNLLPLAVAYGTLKRVPVVLQVYGVDVWAQPTRSAAFWIRRVAAVWTISYFTRDRMNAWARLPASRYVLIPPTVRAEDFGPAARRADLVARYRLEGCTVIMTLGRLASSERFKGIDEVMEALPSLLDTHPDLRYLIVGDGDDLPRLQEKARWLGLAGRVVFTGFVEEANKADYLRLADVFALPGRAEGFGIVYLEALACGVPVVGSLADASREALLEGDLGDLVDPADPASIRAGILRALGRPKHVPPGLRQFEWPAFARRVSDAVLAIGRTE
ncbi:MAG: glycosyltransferase family 4 protein [Telluria sp.]|nr:glycosyltransferase family 4 protein [Telluria sp.]